MERSESIGKLTEALAKAQAVMGESVKGAINPFFKSTYSTLSSVWEACRKPLTDNGLAVIQTAVCIAEHPEMVAIETTLSHSSGEYVIGTMSAKLVKADPQSIGSCVTYLRRYSLAAICGISPEDDDAESTTERKHPPVKKPDLPETVPPPVPSPDAPEPPSLLLPGSPLHKKLEAKIAEANINRDMFKDWLASVGWLQQEGGHLSLKSLSEKNATYICNKWESAKNTFSLWIDKVMENMTVNAESLEKNE